MRSGVIRSVGADSGDMPHGIDDRVVSASDPNLAHTLDADTLDADRVDVRIVCSSIKIASSDGTSAFTGMWYTARLAFIGRPERGSMLACSCSANDTPQIFNWCIKRRYLDRNPTHSTAFTVGPQHLR